MVITEKEILVRKNRRWLRAHIYLICRFRLLYGQEQKSKDSQEKNRIKRKIQHLDNEIDQHVAYGKMLGWREEQIKKLNLTIVEKVKKGKYPKMIIQELLEVKNPNINRSSPLHPCRLRLARFRTPGSHPGNHGFESHRRHFFAP